MKKGDKKYKQKNIKIMKIVKLSSLIVLTILAFSCSSNEEDSLSSNSIVGTWKPIAEVGVCSTGKEDVSVYTSCEQESRYIFKLHNNQSLETDGTLTGTKKTLENGECEIYSTGKISTWSLKDGVFTVDNEIVTFFELESNVFRAGSYDNDPNDPCDGGNLPSHYYTEFVRAN